MSERIVSLGDGQKLDLEKGYVYDAAGNQVARWSPMDNKYAEPMSLYCSEQAAINAASALGPVRGQQYLASWRASLGERTVSMDLGVGDVHLPAALPNVALGYKNESPMADVVSAPLMVVKPSDRYFEFDKADAFEQVAPMLGAPAGQVPEIAPRLSNKTFTTTEYALAGFVSTQVDAAADAPLRIRQATAKRIMSGLTIGREMRVAAMLTAGGSWDADVVKTLLAAEKWNGGANADPVKVLTDACAASWGGVSGIVMSLPVWNTFVQHPKVQDFLKYKDAIAPIPSAEVLSERTGLPPIYVARMQVKTATSKSYIWGNNVVLFRSPEQMPPATQDDTATSYTFRWNAGGVSDGVAQGGFLVREYFVQDRGSLGGSKMVVCHFDAEQMTSKFVGGLVVGAHQ